MSRGFKLWFLGLAVAVIAIAALPWWLGLALRPILRSEGIVFDHYERVGYAHFRLQNVHYANGRVEFSARQIQTSTPLVWLGQRWFGAGPSVMVDGWLLQRRPAEPRDPAGPPAVTGLRELQTVVRRVVPPLNRWLPHAHFQAGEFRGFGPVMTVAAATWQESSLALSGVRFAGHAVSLGLAPGADASLILTAHTDDNEARLWVVWSGADLKGEGVLWEQPLQLAAHFPDTGWLPAEASAVAENWRLPAARVKLGVPYAQVLGDARFLWRAGGWDLTAKANAEPAAKTKAPRFEARAAAHGNLRELTLTALHLDAPFGTAELTAPVTFGFDRPLAGESAQLTLEADLAKLPGLEARGQIRGFVKVTGGTAATRQVFQLAGHDISVGRFALAQATARGELAWPLLKVEELAVQLDQASSATMHGSVNWQTREFADVALKAKLTPAWFAPWVPEGLSWGEAIASATLEGPLDAPRHQGSIQLTAAQWPPLRPVTINASWQGHAAELEAVTGRIAAGPSTLAFTGSLNAQGAKLGKLEFAPGGQRVWQLSAPAQLSWDGAGLFSGLQLAGPASRLGFASPGGPDGSFNFAATAFDSLWLQDWISLPGPRWQVRELKMNGRVVDGTLAFDLEGRAQIAMSPQAAEVKLVATGDAQGVQLKELSVGESGRVLTQATGRLPLSWKTRSRQHLSVDESAPLELSASTEPDSPLWAALAAATGLTLVEPAATLHLKGTLREPAGELQVQAKTLNLAVAAKNFSLPELTDLNLDLQFGRGAVTLKTLVTKVDGQAVEASGHLPMNEQGWRQLWVDPAAIDWSQAKARLEIPDSDLAVLAHRIPDFVAPSGRLRAHIQLSPGASFTGELQLTNAAARPHAPFSTLQEINADLGLAGRTVTLRAVKATLGGEPVTLAGTATLGPDQAWRLALALKGENLPLVRNTGLLVRTDLDLHADTDAAGLTTVAGAVTLRDCLVLANLGTLLPTGQRGVTRQPPYFAVAAEPFRHWPLAVTVRGAQAVRVRTAVFNGIASASFHLTGTLGEPRAVGELTVDRGQVLFPFATLAVQTGAVRLRESDPFKAMVNLNATSQRQGYQLRLDVSGALPAPSVILTSTPALDAEEVLLMVMTGQSPNSLATPSSGNQRLAFLGAYLGRGLFRDLGLGDEDRLEISSGLQISAQGRETYEFEYKLDPRWSLTGEYDQFDSYNAGLKWRVYTREGKPLEPKK